MLDLNIARLRQIDAQFASPDERAPELASAAAHRQRVRPAGGAGFECGRER
ncbi:hypothetical protein OWR29_35755 [Actinoplanes sp. Pm04-4]|uniref:Uncharacterized protein n=1 Tax=Paractinoplanes pyxinae TaxID=2997416 RepID=A0ABT4BCQ2_9ACTN|nr:hypothetical protein [Actinoplanes pyxinae]MCY1143383.1 hypothetical protein [Actinoplanes pyxinae]